MTRSCLSRLTLHIAFFLVDKSCLSFRLSFMLQAVWGRPALFAVD